jgi:hypothetical protein
VVLAEVVLLAKVVLAKTLPIALPKTVRMALSARRSLKMERLQSKIARRALAVVAVVRLKNSTFNRASNRFGTEFIAASFSFLLDCYLRIATRWLHYLSGLVNY